MYTLEHLAEVAENTREEIRSVWLYSWRKYGRLTSMAANRIDLLRKKLSMINELSEKEFDRARKKWQF